MSAVLPAQLKERVPQAPVKRMELPVISAATEAARTPNAGAVYTSLKAMIPNGRAFAVDNISLVRDAGVVELKHGTVYLYGPINGRSMGAAFLGEGVLHVDPPTDAERRQLKTLMKTEVLAQPFQQAAFLFTDATGAELESHAGAAATGIGEAMSVAQDIQKLFDKDLGVDAPLHMLEGALGEAGKGGFFAVMTKGATFSKRLLFVIDPAGAPQISPDQVALFTSSLDGYDIALAFRMKGERQDAATTTYRIPLQHIDTEIRENGSMPSSLAATRIEAVRDRLQVVRLQLHPTLRVNGVWDEKGRALDFVQGSKDRGEEFGVILRDPLRKGEHIDITTKYAGKDVVEDEGNGNYYPHARDSWYPNISAGLGNFAQYHLVFRVPKSIEVVATGTKVDARVEDKIAVTEWESRVPLTVAGFSMGKFKMAAAPNEKNMPLFLSSYVNTDRPAGGEAASRSVLGGLGTTGMLKYATAETAAAVQVYTNFFGPLPFDHLAITQQSPCSYGQAWPMLVYLPSCYYWDSLVKHQMGLMNGRDNEYWNTVAPHEVAHQWWGHTVGFASYRDQWMSEGFADFSAALYLLETNKTPVQYREYWNSLRKRLTEKNQFGVRPVDVGPVTMGMRTSTSRTGGVYADLVYPKGAYILHMLEMMYWTPQYTVAPFQNAMKAFVKKYSGKVATTEDFQRSMEENMPPWMMLEKGRKDLSWFFNEYVYGTEIPKYIFAGKTTLNADGTTSLQFKLTQSNVSDSFRMIVPMYLHLEGKHVVRIGVVRIDGNKTIEQTANLGKINGKVEKVAINSNFDVLAMD